MNFLTGIFKPEYYTGKIRVKSMIELWIDLKFLYVITQITHWLYKGFE